jgi:hypothetical protein
VGGGTAMQASLEPAGAILRLLAVIATYRSMIASESGHE